MQAGVANWGAGSAEGVAAQAAPLARAARRARGATAKSARLRPSARLGCAANSGADDDAADIRAGRRSCPGHVRQRAAGVRADRGGVERLGREAQATEWSDAAESEEPAVRAVSPAEAARREREEAAQARDSAIEKLNAVKDEAGKNTSQTTELQRTVERMKSERQDMVDARKEADRRRQEAEDAMRSAQDRGTQEVSMLLKRIQQIETELSSERKAHAKTRLISEPRIAAWKAQSSEVDDLEIEDE